MNNTIRLAKKSDSEVILNIYAPYIKNTAVSFEVEVPSVHEFECRIENICKQYPYIVYLSDGNIVGFTYASKHRERQSYCYDVDVSIYVLPQYQGLGIAHKLYSCLFEILKKLGYYNAYASYTVPNEKSQLFHLKFGFSTIGTHHNTGYKLGDWHDVTWMEKTIKPHDKAPTEIISITELSAKCLNEIFNQFL